MTSDEQKTNGRLSERTTSRVGNGVRAGNYTELLVWRKGIEVVKQTYRITARFPADEKFGLVSQMRRAAVSIPSNIAEGQARHTTREFIQFISHAEGSLAELRTQLLIAVELDFCLKTNAQPAFTLMADLRKMLNALRRALGTRLSSLVTRHSPVARLETE